MKYKCAHCGKVASKAAGHVNRARERGLNLYCNRLCSGLGRRQHKTKAQKVADKKAYDAIYRATNLATIKAKKHEHFKRTYDPEAARIERKKRAGAHVEYCRRPEYKRWKQTYDRKHRAGKFYGPFAEAAMLMTDLNLEIKGRMTNEQIKWDNGTANKAQFRKRQEKGGQERSRPRHRGRRDRDTPAHGE